jgi:DNA-binding winged helix-turn-helix (wHTH) protein/Flp pilus assembly protein TadD
MLGQENIKSFSNATAVKLIRFGTFEVDLEQRELRKDGTRLPLQHKPFRILELLLQQPGTLVTRQDLAKELWPGLHVNFEHGLNSAMNTLRQVLGDSPRDSQFIETRSGLGYRFIAPIEGETATSTHTTSNAYQDYLRGRFFLNKMTGSGVQRAIGCFQSGLKDDPNYALALSGMADAHSQLALGGTVHSSEVCHAAREFVSDALRAEPNLAEAHVALGRLRMTFDWDWTGAAEAFKRAIQLDPDSPDGYRARALMFSALNRHEEALRDMRYAHAMDPLSLPIGYELAWLLYLAKRFAEAAEQSWAVLSLDSGFFPAQDILGSAYERLGSHEEAMTECENACACSDRHPRALASFGYACASAGATKKAENTLDELLELSKRQHVSPCFVALVELAIGRQRDALDSLESACAQRDPLLLWLNAEPRFTTLRSDHDFAKLVRRTHGVEFITVGGSV